MGERVVKMVAMNLLFHTFPKLENLVMIGVGQLAFYASCNYMEIIMLLFNVVYMLQIDKFP